MTSPRTAVVMFTDVVGSTARDRRLGARAADAFRNEHFAESAEIVAIHGGWLVKTMGDGLMVVFESSTVAVDCAVALQQRVADRNDGGDPAFIRIGVSAGEIVVEDGDGFGAPVVEAARLCAEASAGEILIADVVRVLSRSLAHPLRSIGTKTLKGIDTPIDVHLVEWRPLVSDEPSGFDFVDLQADLGERAARVLDMIGGNPFMSGVRDRILELLDPRPGEAFLDVGSGAGGDVMMLWSLVAPDGRAVGVDRSEKMVDEARARAAGAAFGQVKFVVGDAERLEFDDDSFDGVRSDRVFQYLLEPVRALREAARVTRPGGRVVVAETDWESAVFDLPDDGLTGRINRAWLESRPNGRAGHQLFRLFKMAGLTDVTVEARTNVTTELDQLYTGVVRSLATQAVRATVITADEASRWIASLELAAEDGLFLRAFTTFIVAGRVPA